MTRPKQRKKQSIPLKKSLWLKLQMQSRLKVWISRITIALTLVLLIVVVLKVMSIAKTYVTPLSPLQPFSSEKENKWEKGHQQFIGIWLQDGESPAFRNALFVIRPTDPSFHVLILPSDLSAKGTYDLQTYLSLPIDNYIVAKSNPHEESQKTLESVIEYLRLQFESSTSYFSLPQFFNHVKENVYTDLTPQALVSLVRLFRSMPDDSIVVKELPQQSTDFEKVREDIFADPEIVESGLSIWVRNTTSIPGLATETTGYARNIGFEIIRTDTADCRTVGLISCDGTKSFLLTSQSLINTYSVKRLGAILGIIPQVANGDDLKRADIILLLGEDFQREKAYE